MKDIKITIDGKEIITKEGKNVLDSALEAGIYIPHLCHHPDLPELGACRLCVVEHNGKIVTSCTLKSEEGMTVKTQSEQINKKRQLAMELILAAHPEECSTCPKYGKCELQVLIQYLGVGPERLRMRVKPFPKNTSNLLFDHDMTRCVLCGRCARVCQKVRKVNAIDYQKKNGEIYIGTPHEKLLIDSDCKFCGACVEICPTGALMDKKELRAPQERVLPISRSSWPVSVSKSRSTASRCSSTKVARPIIPPHSYRPRKKTSSSRLR